MQLTWKVGLTGEEYVSQKAWTSASLKRCPHHPKGGCGFRYLGTYERLEPTGALVPRWYCPTAQQTFSLLPDCLAARFPGVLRDVERVVDDVEKIGAVEIAARVVRSHDVLLPGAVRWTRRRLNAVRATLNTLIGVMPERFSGCQPTLVSFRDVLGVELVLPALREIAADHLAALPPPVGFASRSRRDFGGNDRIAHSKGPDPPRITR